MCLFKRVLSACIDVLMYISFLKDSFLCFSFKVNVPGFGNDVVINVEMKCECNCEIDNSGVKNSPKCNGTGTLQCGICYCNEGRFGKECECGSDAQADKSQCKLSNSTDETICSGLEIVYVESVNVTREK